jgi:hypothetical protein
LGLKAEGEDDGRALASAFTVRVNTCPFDVVARGEGRARIRKADGEDDSRSSASGEVSDWVKARLIEWERTGHVKNSGAS